MKLNHDCVRDLLMAVEELPNITMLYSLVYLSENGHLKNCDYSLDDLAYTASRLREANYLHASPNQSADYYYVKNLTYDGHLFLDSIRDPLIWKKTKEATSTVASVSLKTVFELGTQLGTQFVKKAIGLD
ncbi:DUF2513 domain-containing protein [Rummeliibacillus stabekisii]|uniref:DUF2513 domain-containing protein n=1 Tax=Rummeliibacillus stabekisii TaxID=241244 RepID=A0A143HBW5_9BACL|nr:DUF2513 domain-containing protein [Rummeliibacillus stabekisii]AMW99238.1 hypothetical protein ATY39_07020 [Rummeliibacillus stabekisii]